MNKLLATLAAVAMLSGCAAWTTPSTYSNHSTAAGNAIVAQGRAAQYAAMANTSYNCPSCASGQPALDAYGNPRHAAQAMAVPAPPGERFIEAVAQDFLDNLRWAISRKTYEALYD